MPFKLNNALHFRMMNDVFRPFFKKKIFLVFFYDILVYNKTEKDYLYHLKVGLRILA